MRSRYTAYVLNNEAYLLATWHASTRPESLGLATQPSAQWLGLEVKKHDAASTSANIAANIAANVTASVEFVARYRINGRAVRLHEISRFVHEAGCWYYVDGVVD